MMKVMIQKWIAEILFKVVDRTLNFCYNKPIATIVYRLGHWVFISASRVRFSVVAPNLPVA